MERYNEWGSCLGLYGHVVIIVRQAVRAEADGVATTDTRSHKTLFTGELTESDREEGGTRWDHSYRAKSASNILQF